MPDNDEVVLKDSTPLQDDPPPFEALVKSTLSLELGTGNTGVLHMAFILIV